MNKFNILFLTSLLLSAVSIATPKDELLELLKNKPFIYNPNDAIPNYTYKGTEFKIDPETGNLYFEKDGKKTVVKLKWEGFKGKILQGKDIMYRLNKFSTTKEDRAAFNALALYQRLLGIHTIKTKNPECYIAYAQERFKSDPVERLLALERNDNPRPLTFKTDEEWQEFQNDLKNLFADFKSPQSYIVLLGSSSTFFSVNPTKGDSLALFIPAPQCLENAKDPKITELVRTMDNPGAELSDIDINILSPELSDLCERAMDDSAEFGNDGTRRVYVENALDECFNKSENPNIKALAEGGTMGEKWALKGKASEEFLEKWTPRLDEREINFSVRIRPDQQKAPAKKADAPRDFEQDISYEKFVIPLN